MAAKRVEMARLRQIDQPLAAGSPDPAIIGKATQGALRGLVERRLIERVFEPEQAGFGSLGQNRARHHRRQPPMAIDHQLDVRSDCSPHRKNALDPGAK